MQTGTHCPQYQEVMFASTHNPFCNLEKPSVHRAWSCKCTSTFKYKHRCLHQFDVTGSKWQNIWCLVCCHWLLARPSKHAQTRQRSWHTWRDGTKPSLQPRTESQRGRSPRCLLVFPPADPHGYRRSPTQGSHRETGRKPAIWSVRGTRSTSFILKKPDPASPPSALSSHLHPTAAYVVKLWLLSLLRGQTVHLIGLKGMGKLATESKVLNSLNEWSPGGQGN